MTKVGLNAIDKSTTLESNKSLMASDEWESTCQVAVLSALGAVA